MQKKFLIFISLVTGICAVHEQQARSLTIKNTDALPLGVIQVMRGNTRNDIFGKDKWSSADRRFTHISIVKGNQEFSTPIQTNDGFTLSFTYLNRSFEERMPSGPDNICIQVNQQGMHFCPNISGALQGITMTAPVSGTFGPAK